MPIHERRDHLRISDHVYFDYRIINSGEYCSDSKLTNELLGESGQRYMEASQFFQNIDYELAELTQAIASKEPALAHYLNLINAKIDYLTRQMLMTNTIQLHKVDISLGGMGFKTAEMLKEHTQLKMVIYTKPKMVPIIVDASVVYSQYQSDTHYHTAVVFNELSEEHEQLLSQHLLSVQVKGRGD